MAVRRHRPTWILAALACARVAPALAEEPPPESGLEDPIADAQLEEERARGELDLKTLLETPVEVWTPSRAPQPATEAPAIITTITREQMRVWGHRSVAELLAHLVGFYIIDDHAQPNVAVRGSSGGLHSDSSLIKVLIDGHPVSFMPTGGNWIGPELCPLSAIERIEIIRGPASALYGADAFLGMINLRTAREPGQNGASAAIAVGRVGEKPATDVDAALATARGPIEILAGYRQTEQDLSGLELPASSPRPRIPSYNRGTRRARGLDQHSSTGLLRVSWSPKSGHRLDLFGTFSSIDRGAEFGPLYQLAHGYNERNSFSENRISQWHGRAGMALETALAETLSLALRGAYFHGGTRDRNQLEVNNDFFVVRRRMRFRGGDFDAHLEWAPTPSSSIAGGFGLVVDNERLPARLAVAKRPIEGSARGEVIPAASAYQERKTFYNLAAYLQASHRAFDGRIGVTGGLRADRHNVYGAQLSRRIGLVGSPRPNLHVKLLHGSAFQAPSPFLLYAVPAAGGDVAGNPGLRPQYVNTWEAELAWEPVAGSKLSSTVAYNRLQDRTEFTYQGFNLVARNAARTSTLSWENRAELAFRQWLNAHASFELQRSRLLTAAPGYYFQLTGAEGGGYPRMMVHGGIATQLGPVPARAALLASYIGERRASATNVILNGGAYTLDPYLLLDATVTTESFRVLQHAEQELSFTVSGKNLLGTRAATPGFSGVDYPIAPRAFFVQLNLAL